MDVDYVGRVCSAFKVNGLASICHDHRARHERILIRDQERGQMAHFLTGSHASHWHKGTGQVVSGIGLAIGQKFAQKVGGHGSWGQDINANSLGQILLSHRFGHSVESGFGGAVFNEDLDFFGTSSLAQLSHLIQFIPSPGCQGQRIIALLGQFDSNSRSNARTGSGCVAELGLTSNDILATKTLDDTNDVYEDEENIKKEEVADAMGKYPTDGFFTLGNFIALGSYSSCTELDAKFDTPAQKGHFQGQYCYMSMLAINQTKPQEPTLKEIQRAIDSRRLNLMFPGGMSFLNVPEARSLLSSGLTRFGTCFPNSCSRSEVASLMSLYSLMLSTESETWIVQPMNCIQSRVKDPLKFPDIVFIACFSQIPVKNFFHLVDEFVEPFLFRTVLNGFVCVDSFFLLSGILTAYLTFKELDKTHGRLNVPLFYLHRYLRLTGVYAMLVFFMATIYRYLELGPTSFVNAEVTMCQDTWYRNLFYFNNFQGSDGYCLGHTWYLASDFQFFLVSPLVMIPMWWIQRKWNRSFWTLVYPLVWLIVFTFVIVGLTIANDWPLSSAVAVLDTDYSEHGYVTPWCRCQPYIVGIMLGYILHRSRGQPIQLSWALSYWMWILATATALAILWGVDAHSVWQGAERSSLLASVFYNAGSRLAWALALGWLILACSKNLPGSYWISRFLGWEGFIPLSRLTYCIFLCHLVVTSTLLSFIDYNVYMTHYLA
eukprot:maker-scaffold64_size435223-snap-gene-2.28 protein:Tk02500 transcript:maker-scaffold64_size435223-snap-gene-2.28-mRNA-1 annotation:"hypothetical protein DAPPUDRAFT_60562"